jgi:hypothetical protein
MRPQFEHKPLSFWAGLGRAANWAAGIYLALCALDALLGFWCNLDLAARRAKERQRRNDIRADQLARGLTEDEIEDEDWDAWEQTHELMPIDPEEYASLQELAEHEVRPGFLAAVVLFFALLFLVACVVILSGPDFK